MKITNHRLEGVRFKQTPNYGGAKKGYRFLVIHYDGSMTRSGLNWMLDKQAKVSAELWISRDGEVVQLLDFNKTAWHAGLSTFRTTEGLNSYSIGIELQGNGSVPYTEIQMARLGQVAKLLCDTYNLEIIGHEDCSVLRKVDPSTPKVNLFDWKRLFDDAGKPTTQLTTTSDLNIRRGQGTQYPVVTTLKKGTEVFELNRVGEWSKIQVKGSKQAGWMNNKFLK